MVCSVTRSALAVLLPEISITTNLWNGRGRMRRKDPAWLNLIAPDLKPTEPQVAQLEQLRVEYGIPQEVLAGRVIDSRVTTRKVQAQMASNLRQQMPAESDRRIWEFVLQSRACPPDPHGWGWSEQQVHEAMQHIDGFDELVDFIIEFEDRETPRPPDPTGLGSRIDEILSS